MNTSLIAYLPIAAIVASLFLFTACDDPSNVGIGLVGEQGGQPVAVAEPVTDLAATPLERPNDVPPRVLTGTVSDPLAGTMTAHGYADFTSVASSAFRSGTVESSELRLTPTYLYGDTTAEVTLAIRSVSEEWETDGLPIDTAFAVGEVIREFTFSPTDTLVVVPMPQSWVTTHDEVIRSEDFGDDFHGFRFDPVSGGAVVGFGPSSTVLHSRTANDSASFPVGRAYAALQKTEESVPENRVLLQAGVGPAASFRFELDPDDVSASAVNRLALTFWTDTLSAETALPPNFVRPTLTTLDLYGRTEESGFVFLDRSVIDGEGRFIFDSDVLGREIQATLLGQRRYELFELRIPAPETISDTQSSLRLLSASLSTALFYDDSAEDKAPVGFLTVTPIDG